MRKYQIVLLIIILGAFFLRIWDLPHTPPGLWYDEAYNAIDALWMAETGQYQPFVVGNNGRETMWHFMLLLSISVLGHTGFAVRLVGSIAGILTIPIMYRFARVLCGPFVQKRQHMVWFAGVAAGWLAVSWWHLLNSRNGFRPVLLPPLLMLSLYFFWIGYRAIGRETGRKPLLNFVWAGLFLGLMQYTYLPARFAPVLFGGLALIFSVHIFRRVRFKRDNQALSLGHTLAYFWLGALTSAAVSALVFAPLGLFYLNNPGTFASRTGDVVFVPKNFIEAVTHLATAVSLFFGAGHELYRHHLPGRAMLGWLEIPLFWVGLIYLLRPTLLKRAQTQLILWSFLVMWLPALLASPPVHSLRPIGLLPFYYFIVTVGVYQLARFLVYVASGTRSTSGFKAKHFLAVALVCVALTGLINGYDYFWRWKNHPEVYKEFNGPLADLTAQIEEMTRTQDVIIPFHIYAHPTTRYFLGETFTEIVDTPPPVSHRPVQLMLVPDTFQLQYVGNIPESPALALLTRNEAGQGQVYISRPPRATEQDNINAVLAGAYNTAQPFVDSIERTVAEFITLPAQEYTASLAPLFVDVDPLRTVDLNWDNQARLIGYDVTPVIALPGQQITINLYWHSLTNNTFDARLFVQLVDAAGNPIAQKEEDAFREDMYRWRPDGILSTQHTLWLGPDVSPGPYLVRLGFFNPDTGERLPLITNSEEPIDQVHLGLFYVSVDGTDPRAPATPLAANFADKIELIGVTLPDLQGSGVRGQESGETPNSELGTLNLKPGTLNSELKTVFHWKTIQPTDKPYTVFLQLLNQNGDVVSSWDSQPLNGLYPTNLWSPGEAIADTFLLPLPEGGLPPGNYRLIAGLYDFETFQRLALTTGGDFAELVKFEVE